MLTGTKGVYGKVLRLFHRSSLRVSKDHENHSRMVNSNLFLQVVMILNNTTIYLRNVAQCMVKNVCNKSMCLHIDNTTKITMNNINKLVQYCAKVMQGKTTNFVLCSPNLSLKVRAKIQAENLRCLEWQLARTKCDIEMNFCYLNDNLRSIALFHNSQVHIRNFTRHYCRQSLTQYWYELRVM